MKKLIVLAIALACAGCASIPSSVSSYTSPAFDPQAVHVVVARSQAQQDSLEFAEYSLQATRALTAANIRVDNANLNPAVAVIIDYGIGAPEVSLTTQTTSIMGRVETDKLDKDGHPKSTWGVVGYKDVPVTVTEYSKYLTITAIRFSDLKAGRAQQIWKVDVRNTNDRRDLRAMMPFMLAAAVPYMGKSSGIEQRSNVPLNQENANYILTGIHNQAVFSSN